jgi:hypothetical protein
MIVVIVRDDHCINLRQFIKQESRRKEALWTRPLRWRSTFLPHWIDQESHAVHFDQGGCVAKPGDAQARARARVIDAPVSTKRPRHAARNARRSAKENARTHLEHQRKAADIRWHRVHIPFAPALRSCQRHVYPMAVFQLEMQIANIRCRRTDCNGGPARQFIWCPGRHAWQ